MAPSPRSSVPLVAAGVTAPSRLPVTARLAMAALLAGVLALGVGAVWRHDALLAGLAATLAGLVLWALAMRDGGSGRAQDPAVVWSRGVAATLRDAVDTLADGFVLYDADDRLLLANRKYRELHAVNPLAGVPGVAFADEIRAAIACGEIPLGGKDTEAVLRERLACHRNPAGAIERSYSGGWLRISERRTSDGGTVGVHADITAQKQAQAAAEAAGQLLRDAVDSVSAGFAMYDAEDRLVLCNEPYKQLYPSSAALMVPGARFEDILRAGVASGGIPDAVGREEAWIAERLRRRRRGVMNVEERHMNGRWILITERRTRDGGIAGIRIDITAQKQTQAELEAARARMADFAEAASDWFWEADPDGRMTYVDAPFEKATGVPAKSRLGALRLDLNQALDPHNPGWETHLADVAARRPFRDFIMTVAFPTGFRHLSVSGKPIRGPGGEFVGYRGTTRDATVETEAGRALARQAEELVQTTEKLQAANAAKSLFLANMSHELRTPLNAILGFSEIMRDAQVGPVDPRYRGYAADIHVAGEYLLRLINDVLDTAKMEAGELALHEEEVPLAEIVEACRRLVQEKASAARIALVVDVPPALPPVFVDRLRLTQSILNIVSNAVKFTPADGRVTVSVIGPGQDGLAIVVADTGIGMKASDIPLALEPFRQIDGSFARRYEGTGLGLPLAKAFIERHGGRLEIDSEPDKGTTVRAWLPARRVISAGSPQGTPRSAENAEL